MRAKTEKTPSLVGLWLDTLYGRAEVSVREKIEKTLFLAWLWLGLGQKYSKTTFW